MKKLLASVIVLKVIIPEIEFPVRSASWFSQHCDETEINCTVVMLLFSNYLFENEMVFSSEFNHIRNDYHNRNETITSQLRQEGNQMHFFP